MRQTEFMFGLIFLTPLQSIIIALIKLPLFDKHVLVRAMNTRSKQG